MLRKLALESVPSLVIERPLLKGRRANERDAEGAIPHPPDFTQFHAERHVRGRQEQGQTHVASGKDRSIACDGTSGQRQIFQNPFADKRCAGKDNRAGDSQAVGRSAFK
jgi:hypothetical protein